MQHGRVLSPSLGRRVNTIGCSYFITENICRCWDSAWFAQAVSGDHLLEALFSQFPAWVPSVTFLSSKD